MIISDHFLFPYLFNVRPIFLIYIYLYLMLSLKKISPMVCVLLFVVDRCEIKRKDATLSMFEDKSSHHIVNKYKVNSFDYSICHLLVF